MQIAVLVQAHKYPQQIQRMLRPFRQHSSFDIFVNIDKKQDITPFQEAISEASFIRKRVPIYWSNLSQVQGMLNSWEEIIAGGKQYDYHIFMSGQDYLLQPVEKILNLLESNKGREYIECEPMGSDGLDWDIRYKKYYYTHKSPLFQRLARYVQKLSPSTRKYPIFKQQFGGAAWLMLTNEAVTYLLNFCREHPKFVDFHKHTWCPDEFLFHTILMNSPFKDKIHQNNYWYMEWFNQIYNPKILRTWDYAKIISSNKLFARKFDETVDSEIMDMIDNFRGGNKS